jgi:hypothetical protein
MRTVIAVVTLCCLLALPSGAAAQRAAKGLKWSTSSDVK